jgi:RNA polymerase sigma-70 factor (ECF subfamily)
MPTDGAELIRRMAGGDRDAFAAFYDAYAPLAFGLIRRILRSPAAAEEVLQEVFWEIWRSAADYDPGRGSPEARVVMRARSRGIDMARSIRRRGEMLATSPAREPAAVPDEPGRDPAVDAEERTAIRGALEQLPRNQQEIIELAYLEGLTQTEIAQRLGQPLGTVKTRMRLGMERLRSLMGSRR